MQVIRFRVLRFEVEYNDNFCSTERLRYYNGLDIWSAQFIDYCGYSSPNLPVSNANGATFEFQSGSAYVPFINTYLIIADRHHGFEIIYDAINSSDSLRSSSNEAFRE